MKPSPRTATFGIAAAAWIALTAYYIASGFEPDFWLGNIDYENDGYYPYALVREFSAISAGEIATLLLIVRPWSFRGLRGLRGRMLVAFILFLLWTMGWVAAAMHQPPVQSAHLLWLFALVPSLLVALIGVSIATWIRSRRTRLPGENASEDAGAAADRTSRPHVQSPSSADEARILENARAALVSPLQDARIYLNPAEVPPDITYPSEWSGFGLHISPNSWHPSAWATFADSMPWVYAWLHRCVQGTVLVVDAEVSLGYVFTIDGELCLYLGGRPTKGVESDSLAKLPDHLQRFYRELHDGFGFYIGYTVGPARICDFCLIEDICDVESPGMPLLMGVFHNGGGDCLAIDLASNQSSAYLWWHDEATMVQPVDDLWSAMDTWISNILEHSDPKEAGLPSARIGAQPSAELQVIENDPCHPLHEHFPRELRHVWSAAMSAQPQNASASSVDYYVEADIDEEVLLECLSEHLATGVASAEYPSPSAKYYLMHLTHREGFSCHVCLCWRNDETTVDELSVALHVAVSLRTRVIFELPCKTFPTSHGWLLVDQLGTQFTTEIEEGEDGIWPAAGTTIRLPSQLQPPTSFPKHL